MTWHHIALALIGVGTGIAGFLIPGAASFTTPVAWTLVGGALGNATVGPAIRRLLEGAAPPSSPPAPPAPPAPPH